MAIIEGTNYAKREKSVLRIILPDGDGGELPLSVLPPTKGVNDALMGLAEALDRVNDGSMEEDDFDLGQAYSTVSKAMSRNVERRKVTPDELEEMNFDIEDVGDFIGSYIFFMSELVRAKN